MIWTKSNWIELAQGDRDITKHMKYCIGLILTEVRDILKMEHQTLDFADPLKLTTVTTSIQLISRLN